MTSTLIKIGVRGSKLALAYAQKAIDAIGEGEIEIIKTDGDLFPDTPIHEAIHGVFQVMKRGENLKDQEVISFLENDLIKSGPEFDKLETAQVWLRRN